MFGTYDVLIKSMHGNEFDNMSFEELQIVKFLTNDEYIFQTFHNYSVQNYSLKRVGCFFCEEPLGPVQKYYRTHNRKSLAYISMHINCTKATINSAIEKIISKVEDTMEDILGKDILSIIKKELETEYFEKIRKSKVIKCMV
jgi:hypothetical protein